MRVINFIDKAKLEKRKYKLIQILFSATFPMILTFQTDILTFQTNFLRSDYCAIGLEFRGQKV